MLKSKDAELEQLKARVAVLESSDRPVEAAFPPLFSNIVKKNVKLTSTETNVLNAVAHESIEQQKRSQNLMIYGVPESTRAAAEEKAADDTDKVNQILDRIVGSNRNTSAIKRVHRLKSGTTARPRPLVVEFDPSTGQRSKVLDGAKTLSQGDSPFKNVFIGPDLTPAQRERRRQLVAECAESNRPLRGTDGKLNGIHCYIIRDDQVVRVVRRRN